MCTLNRLEHCPEDVEQGADSRYHKIGHSPEQIEGLFVKLFLESYSKEPRQIILDLDVTDDLVHGSQEQVFFNTYYRGYCYAPLYIFCGKHLLAAKLRPSNVDPAFGALSELQRVIKQIRQQWKNVEVLVRGDSAYSRDDIMTWCESQPGLDYVFGLAQPASANKTAVLAAAQNLGVKPQNETTCPSDAPLKGKIRKEKGNIYHVPKSPNYDRVKPDICFKDPATAQKAGFRAPK